jgi:hypothetical protein
VKCPKCHTESSPDMNFCAKRESRLSSDASSSQTTAVNAPSQILALGTIFAGKVRIHEQIDRGGVGIVYQEEVA